VGTYGNKEERRHEKMQSNKQDELYARKLEAAAKAQTWQKHTFNIVILS